MGRAPCGARGWASNSRWPTKSSPGGLRDEFPEQEGVPPDHSPTLPDRLTALHSERSSEHLSSDSTLPNKLPTHLVTSVGYQRS